MQAPQAVKVVSARDAAKRGADARTGDKVGYLLKSLMHCVRQGLDESCRRQGLGVSFAHIPALYFAQLEPGSSGAELARRLLVTAQSMHAILTRLERQGYTERKPHPHNRRTECWSVTRSGVRQLDLARSASGVVWDRMLSLLSAEETQHLGELLERCIRGLESSTGRTTGSVTQLSVRRAKARTGKVPTPLNFGGTALKQKRRP
ncbi:MAG TPA: MarR family winged helix-turn-helix transcriptional regulator [Steroidobacteraceae bacterium]|nr:MarR family winged helix-turn-helix transcriptional regulator [Steroidobacteraceae bacterium]